MFRLSGQAILGRFKKLIRPVIIDDRGDPFMAAQFGNCDFFSKTFQHDLDLLIR